MNVVYLLLGSNEGDRFDWLEKGKAMIRESGNVIVSVSAIYETAAWGLEEQPDFLNQVIRINTTFNPTDLLKNIQQVENILGRQRTVKWGQRTLDIDILLYNDEVVDLPELHIPHPFLAKRRFTLAPLAEIAPDIIHPIDKKTMLELLNDCPDSLPVKKVG
ncbi:MAG: 2-amino-4-hydroxy-6-hydroxymethyldihydropteridine diphosphokinase [Flavipsychrobacter sp.]